MKMPWQSRIEEPTFGPESVHDVNTRAQVHADPPNDRFIVGCVTGLLIVFAAFVLAGAIFAVLCFVGIWQ